MINIENRKMMYIINEALEYGVNFSCVRLDAQIETFNLKSISHVTVVDSIENDKSRLLKDYQSRRNSNVMAGAVAGTLFDAFSGDDDSIIDGLVIGAGAGYLFTSNQVEPKAQISLSFTDGRSLPLELNKEEYTLLIGKIKALATITPLVTDTHRTLTESEINRVLSTRPELSIPAYLKDVIIPAVPVFIILITFHQFDVLSLNDFKINWRESEGDFGVGSNFFPSDILFDISTFLFNFMVGTVLLGLLVMVLITITNGIYCIWGIKTLPKKAEWEVQGFFDKEEYLYAQSLPNLHETTSLHRTP